MGSFGTAASGAGDVNGDGFADVAVGAPMNGTYGQVFVYLGGALGLATTSWATLNGASDYAARLGAAITPAGDYDGDGRDDFVAVAGAGDVRVYYDLRAGTDGCLIDSPGQVSPGNVPAVAYTGVTSSDGLVHIVVGFGDTSGDVLDCRIYTCATIPVPSGSTRFGTAVARSARACAGPST
jgi:hypothetical protein